MAELKTLKTLVFEKIKEYGLSDRAAAEKIGCAHTTIGRIRNDEPLDITTLRRVADWLGVKLSELIAAEEESIDGLAARISVLLQHDPELRKLFKEGLVRVEDGRLSPEQFRELLAYATYRFHLADLEKEKDQERQI